MKITKKNIKRFIDDAVTTGRFMSFETADGTVTDDIITVSIYYKRNNEDINLLMDDVWHVDVKHFDNTGFHFASFNKRFHLTVEQSEIFDHVWRYVHDYKTAWITE